jgi:hypothetical protein
MRSGKLMRLYARADSRPRNAANGDMLDSYADRYRSKPSPDDVVDDICTVDGFGLVAYDDAEEEVGPALLYVETYLVFS